MLTRRFSEALEYARDAHNGQFRKGTKIPYIYHPMAVSSLVIEHGGDEDQAIAALLHDVVEDCGEHHADAIRKLFGTRVADIVLACTDGTRESKAEATTPEAKRADWRARKEQYLAQLPHHTDDVLLVSCCDKLHNAAAILADLKRSDPGIKVFERFVGGREGTLWYYDELAKVFSAQDTAAAPLLLVTVADMKALAKLS